MPLPHDFDKVLTERTDEQLYDMLAHEGDYEPEALAAARAEIERRNLTPFQVAQLETNSHAVRAQEQESAQRRLGWVGRTAIILSAAIGVSVVALVAWLRRRGA